MSHSDYNDATVWQSVVVVLLLRGVVDAAGAASSSTTWTQQFGSGWQHPGGSRRSTPTSATTTSQPHFTVEAAQSPADPTVRWLLRGKPTALREPTVRAASDLAALTVRFVRAAGSPAVLTNDGCISSSHHSSFSSGHSLQPEKKKIGRP
jgi:hypothetical protein